MKDYLIIFALVILVILGFQWFQSDGGVVVNMTPTPFVLSVGTPEPIQIVEPAWTSFYAIPTVTPESRGGFVGEVQPTGIVGNHEPGTNHSRTP